MEMEFGISNSKNRLLTIFFSILGRQENDSLSGWKNR